MTGVRQGVLWLADISGYTRFLTSVELEHSTDVLADLLGVVIEQTHGVLSLSKLEGDAVFCYAERDLSGQELLTLIEAAYFAFRKRLRDISHLTTCQCNACRQIPSLDLKLIIHAGEFAFHDIAGHHELLGSDVIAVHRLLKNGTGLDGYALLTDAALTGAGIDPLMLGAEVQSAEVEGVGRMQFAVVDLQRWWRESESQTRVNLGEEDGTAPIMSIEIAASAAVVWDWIADPVRRQRWNGADSIDVVENPGMPGVGTVNHCVHGKMKIREEVVDWHPFDYATLRSIAPFGSFLFTMSVSDGAAGLGSRVDVHIRADGTGFKRAMWPLVSRKIKSNFAGGLARMRSLIEAGDALSLVPPPTP